ncbi:MAG: hypothetical protein RLZZ628_1724 [Bacteroidota bacterium]
MPRITQIIRKNCDVSFLGYTFGYIVIQMDVRISRISPMGTDFFLSFRRNLSFLRKDKKKSVSIGEIREIRTSIRIAICNLLFASNETALKICVIRVIRGKNGADSSKTLKTNFQSSKNVSPHTGFKIASSSSV